MMSKSYNFCDLRRSIRVTAHTSYSNSTIKIQPLLIKKNSFGLLQHEADEKKKPENVDKVMNNIFL